MADYNSFVLEGIKIILPITTRSLLKRFVGDAANLLI